MALKFIVQAECDRLNRQSRQVEYLSAFSENKYWQRGQLGDFLITGGEQNERANAVISYAQESLRNSLKPVIILDGTGTLESSLISLYTANTRDNVANTQGILRVYSPSYRGYDVFGSMNLYTALQFLTDATKDRPRGSEISPAYIEAFLSTLKSVSPLTLDGMRQLADRTDEEIVRIACRVGAQQRFIDSLKDPEKSSENFRSFLARMENAFSNIWNRDTAIGNNISGDLKNSGIIYINAQSKDPVLFNKYFSSVLEYIGSSRYTLFDVIFYDVTTKPDDGLLTHVESAMHRSNERIGICSSNISSLIHQCPYICDMPRHIIYTSSRSMVPVELLKSYGQYEYHFPMMVPGANPIPFPWNHHFVIAVMMKDRLTPADLNRHRIGKIMKGHNGEEIALVRNA